MADEGIYKYAREVEIPEKSVDKIARIALTRFNEAVRWQGMERVGGKPLRAVLRECYDQYNGILSPRDKEIADEIGVDAYVNLTAMKSGLVASYLLESLVQPTEIPWALEPTPRPDLSSQGIMEVAQRAQREFAQLAQMGMAPGRDGEDLIIGRLKRQMLRSEYDVAKQRATAMERLMADQLMEGGWNRAMYGFATDFSVYPFAVLQGPVPVIRPRAVWQGDRMVMRSLAAYEFQAVSPWDFWYTPDSPDTQRGTGVFIRQRWTRRQLMDAGKMPSYREKEIIEVIKETDQAGYVYHWLSPNPDQPDNALHLWRQCAADVDVLIHYGFLSGRELREQGVQGLEDSHFYNAQLTIIGKRCVQVMVNTRPGLDTRPIFTTSFYKTRDRIASYSIPQRIRDVERCYLISLRYLIANEAMSSGPIAEADFSRLSKYMTSDDIRLAPNTVYLSSGDVSGQAPALRFYTVPSNVATYQAMLTYFMDLVDRVSNIPAALHGTAQGSGANRTFRGAAMLQGNAVKAIQAAVANIDEYVFGPMGELLYNYNLTYDKDNPDIQGDCRVLARGASGLLQREIDRQNSYEILQMVSSAGQQLMALPNGPKILTWALRNVLGNMGVPEDLLADDGMPPPRAPQAGAPGMAEGVPAPGTGDGGLPPA